MYNGVEIFQYQKFASDKLHCLTLKDIQRIALRLSVSKLKGKSQARKVRCVMINSGVVA